MGGQAIKWCWWELVEVKLRPHSFASAAALPHVGVWLASGGRGADSSMVAIVLFGAHIAVVIGSPVGVEGACHTRRILRRLSRRSPPQLAAGTNVERGRSASHFWLTEP
jgi:hypothetical protein